MSIFKKPKYEQSTSSRRKKIEIPEGLCVKCDDCNEVIFNKDLDQNLKVCPKCGHHFYISAYERIGALCDQASFEELDMELESVDVLRFTGVASYADRLAKYRKSTGMRDAIVCGWGKIDGIKISLAVMDFKFLGGSMGSVVGEKITRSIERAAEHKAPLIIFSASGGARMYEGMYSLMQMAKTNGALALLAQRKVPFISVLTNPTMAGVMASFATLGDLIIAEPKAMIGFAGARVIRETTQQQLPKGFQTAEFLLEHGLIDRIISRNHMREELSKILRYLK